MLFNVHTKRIKFISTVTCLCMLFELAVPLAVPGSRSVRAAGPENVDAAGASSGTGNMVDLFTGDFQYSIPLLDVEGYNLVLNYDGNVGMNQEASWVGLGWSFNPGSVRRQMRGIPDDFKGDTIIKEISYKNYRTDGWNAGYGANLSVGVGPFQLSASTEQKMGNFTNSYEGEGENYESYTGLGLSVSFPSNAGEEGVSFGIGGNLSQRVTQNTLTGISMTNSSSFGLSIGATGDKGNGAGLGVSSGSGTYYSSRGVKTRFNNSGISLSYLNKVNNGENAGSATAAVSRSTYISYGTKTYTPSIQENVRMRNDLTGIYGGYYGLLTPGSPLPKLWAYGLFEDYDNKMYLEKRSIETKAYGYCFLESAPNESIMDFNRSKQGILSQNAKMLPSTTLTNDMFFATASGLSTDFRAYRNDVGTVKDNPGIMNATGSSEIISAGAGFGMPVAFKYVVTDGDQQISAESNEYTQLAQLNQAYSNMRYRDISGVNTESRNFAFRSSGERIPLDEDFYNGYGGANPIKTNPYIPREEENKDIGTYNQFWEYSESGQFIDGSPFPSTNYSATHPKANTMIGLLDASEAAKVGLNKNLEIYSLYTGSDGSYTVEDSSRTTSIRKDHHFSEVSITQPGGGRMFYGVPTYVLKKEEVTFNVSGNGNSCIDGLASYDAASDDSQSNNNGKNNIYVRNRIPAYADAYLISAVLSPDYNDISGNGPTEDDFGSYVKFNYSQVYSAADPFKWRTPISEDSALFMENIKYYDDATNGDDLGYYEYGEKELWYVHSIEGKEYIAEFYLSDRDDLHSVKDEDGGIDVSKPAKKLDRIVLYHKDDRAKFGANAVPIKTVHFVYDYSLCKNYPGNEHTPSTYATSGKLTLKNVYFTYGNSDKGKLETYSFTYGGSNPDFNPAHTDRWNVYKQNECSTTSELSNVDFPYASQERSERDNSVAPWSLTRIDIPSGGNINIEYESDDYAYVQDRIAMEMVPVIGMGTEAEIPSFPNSFESQFRSDNDIANPNNIVYVALPSALDTNDVSAAREELKEKYLSEIIDRYDNQLLYRYKVELKPGSNDYEIIQGYGSILDYDVVGSAPYDTVWIKLKPMPVADDAQSVNGNNVQQYDVSPIAHTAWQYIREHVTRFIYPNNVNALGVDIQSMTDGFNQVVNMKGFCSTFQENQSFVRLLTPDRKKLGGGARVKKITYTDNWSEMKGDGDFTYGTEYEYMMEDSTSSGVAAYEPIIGNEVNPWRQPIRYSMENLHYPDNNYYYETPFGEEMFPAPVIGYRRVKVKSIDHQGVTRNGVGFTVHAFFTHKEFPYRVAHTPISATDRFQSDLGFWQMIIGKTHYDLLALSQGYSVFRNDMHGKQKSVQSFSNQGDLVSSTSYTYREFGEPVKLIDRDGNLDSAIVNRTIEIATDMQKTVTLTNGKGVVAGIQMTTLFPSPVIGLNKSKIEEAILTNVITKQVNDYGMLEEVRHYHLGAETVQRNIAYDKHTGDGIITSTNNEFDDEVYNITFPAHWNADYRGMTHASNTWGNHLSNVNIGSGGTVALSSLNIEAEDYFQRGDELLVTGYTGKDKLWILGIDTTLEILYLMDDIGNMANSTTGVDIKVIRSGCRNMQSASMMQVVQLQNPLIGDTSLVIDSVLSSGALEFDEDWQFRCATIQGCATESYVNCDSVFNGEMVFERYECDTIDQSNEIACGPEIGGSKNPFLHGLLGNWRPEKSYAYRVKRAEQSTGDNTNTRSDGTYDSYIPFYAYSSGSDRWYPIYSANHPDYSATDTENWLQTSEVTKYDEKGRPVESQDALGIYSSVLFGYNEQSQSLPVAVAANARLQDIAFDGFEDYLYRDDIYSGSCEIPGHFSFGHTVSKQVLDSTVSHTGLYSLHLNYGASHAVSRYVNAACTGVTPGSPLRNYTVNDCDCIGDFAPRFGKYIVGAWAREQTDTALENFENPSISVVIKNSGGSTIQSYNFSPSGPIIDGWQRVEGEIDIPSNAHCIVVSLNHDHDNNNPIWFDDFRIHPFRAVFTSIVYDPYSLRKMADLNDYNFASFYEYDEQGMPVRLKVETIEGIRTVTEGRSGLVK